MASVKFYSLSIYLVLPLPYRRDETPESGRRPRRPVHLHRWKRRERDTEVERDRGSWALLSVWLSLDGNVLLHFFVGPLSFISCLFGTWLLNNRPSWVTSVLCDFMYAAIVSCWWWEEVQEGFDCCGKKSPIKTQQKPFVISNFAVFPVQAVCPAGEARLSLWNFIIFNYLDHDGWLSLSLPVPPFHLVTQTLASYCKSVCLPMLTSLP